MRIQGVEVTDAHINAGVYFVPTGHSHDSSHWVRCVITKITENMIHLSEVEGDGWRMSAPENLVWRTKEFGSDLHSQELKDNESKRAVSSFKFANNGHWDTRPACPTINESKHTLMGTISTENSYPHCIPTAPTPGYQTANSTFNPYQYENQASTKIDINNHGSDGLDLKLPNHEIKLQNVPNIPYQGLIFNGTPPTITYKIGAPLKDEDPVNKPTHYNFGTIEPIKVIEDWNLGFHLGNCLKYVARAKHKGNELQDLKKARYYLDRQIDLLERSGK